MNNTRLLFAIATATLAFLLLNQWQAEHMPVAPPQITQAAPPTSAAPTNAATEVPVSLPSVASAETPTAETPMAVAAPATATPTMSATPPESPRYTAETDLYRLVFTLQGADLIDVQLKNYSLSLDRKQDLVTLVALKSDSDTKTNLLKTQSGLLSTTAMVPNHLANYVAPTGKLSLLNGQQALEIPFTWAGADGLSVRKIYRFERGSYAIKVRYELSNQTAQPITLNSYRQLIQLEPPAVSASFFSSPDNFSYVGTAIYTPEKRFEKLPLKTYRESGNSRKITGGWLGSLKHHFLVAWIPEAKETNEFSTQVLPADGANPERMLARINSPILTLAPGASGQFATTLYVGPKLQSTIDQIAPGLSKTVDYGKFTVFSEPLYWLLNKLHSLVMNWGFAIVLLVVIIKLCFYKLAEKQFRSSAKMKAIAPKLEDIKRRYADDKQKQAQAQMELFAKEKVNPFAGCLPALVQIPVFLGLYWVLVESVELRQAPFLFWIKDLTAADPWFVLPVLNALVTYMTTKLTPMTGMDPIQQKMFSYMPIMFGVMMAFFPAGLVLYWTVNGVLTLLQQLYINRKVEAEMALKTKAA